MDSQKELDYMEHLFEPETAYSLVLDPDIIESQSSSFSMDACAMPSSLLSGTSRKDGIRSELAMDEESNMKCKRLKSTPSIQQCMYPSEPENSSPLGLTLRKTPSFLDLVESKLSDANTSFSILRRIKSTNTGASVYQNCGKTKASNFSASLMRIGSWERISRFDGELVAKCYFAKRKLVWEVLDGRLKRKIEVQWSDIASLKATCETNASETLEIELLKRPLFFRETDPQPRKHTMWKATTDFTDEQASIFRRHFLQFPQGTLQKHFDKLLQLDGRLSSLSKNPYPSLDSAYFDTDILESQNPNDAKSFGLEGRSSIASEGFLKSEPIDNYSGLLDSFTLTKTIVPRKCSSLDEGVSSSEIFTQTLGARTNYLGDGTLLSNIYSGVFVSSPPVLPDLRAPKTSESYCNGDMSMGEGKTGLFGNLGLSKGDFNTKSSIHSTSHISPNDWISEIQTYQDLVYPAHDIGHRGEVDEYLDGFSFAGEACDTVENYDNYVDFSAKTSGFTPHPVLW